MKVDDKELLEIQLEVLGYLEEHPNAADTAEGIRQWWLYQRMAKLSHVKVKEALDQLQNAELIDAQELDNGDKLFGLIRSRKFETSKLQVKSILRLITGNKTTVENK